MNHNNIDLENFLYSLIEELSKNNAPIIFKGGLALKDILYLNNPEINVDRRTIDIDANWIDKYNRKEIAETIEQAIKNINPKYTIKITREVEANQSMCIKILDEKGIPITKIDLDIKDNPFYIICNINNVNIKYSDIHKMMADKLFSISGVHIFRRIKDLLDIYLIIINNEIDFAKIAKILEYENRKIGNFQTMLNNKEELEKGYNKLTGIINKPDFDEIWNTIVKYLQKEELI